MLLTNQKTLTLFFSIPHISNLFIYKDNWTNNQIMRPVITEILKSGQFQVHYLGENPEVDFTRVMNDCSDCALISLTLQDIDLADKSAQTVKELFIQEMANRKNRFLFQNEMIDELRNVSSISISIKVQTIRKIEVENFQAA